MVEIPVNKSRFKPLLHEQILPPETVGHLVRARYFVGDFTNNAGIRDLDWEKTAVGSVF
jgi:hypothetical protein